MKKLLLLLAATGICGLVSARYIQAAEEPVDLKQEVIQLCEVNAALADQLHIRLDQEEAKSTYDYHSYVMRFFTTRRAVRLKKCQPASSS